jgi:hypothetical protein
VLPRRRGEESAARIFRGAGLGKDGLGKLGVIADKGIAGQNMPGGIFNSPAATAVYPLLQGQKVEETYLFMVGR